MLHSVLGRTRAAGRRWVVAGAVLVCTVTAGSVVAGPSDAGVQAGTAAASPLSGFVVEVGPEERVYGPTGKVDFPFFSEKTASGKLIGFISNNDSYRTVSRGHNRTLVKPKLILKRGPVGTFDKCGAWLIGSVYQATKRRWIAGYHAEAAGRGDKNRCHYHDESVVASVALAESRDGGLTWRKPKYPHNRIITQDRDLKGARSEDATMGRLLRRGDYLYMFYGATDEYDPEAKKLHVARSPVSAMGRPGSWRKWFCKVEDPSDCGFYQPGLGGRSTAIEGIDPKARVILPNTYLNHYVAAYASGKIGFRLYVSNTTLDGASPWPDSWDGSIPIYPAVSHSEDELVDQWGIRTKRSKQLYGYPSIVNVDGDPNTSGQTFYLYYVKLFPGGDFPERYLMRRKVTLSKTSTGPHRVALTTYFNKSDGRRRTSTERPESNAYRPESTTVYLAGQGNQGATGYNEVFECARDGRFLLRVGTCDLGESKVRRVGWISPDETEEAPIPVYRCYNAKKRNHFASTEIGCRGFGQGTPLGYGLGPVALS